MEGASPAPSIPHLYKESCGKNLPGGLFTFSHSVITTARSASVPLKYVVGIDIAKDTFGACLGRLDTGQHLHFGKETSLPIRRPASRRCSPGQPGSG
jgi:hypothetical protein